MKILGKLATSIIFLVVCAIITGVIYPALVTGIAQLTFTSKANGSVITQQDKDIGSELIGQPFSDPRYFWGRPSATSTFPYNAMASSGSNYSTLNPELRKVIQVRINALKAFDPDNDLPVPIDLVTASACGLDPHISVAAALYQVPRVAKYRKLTVGKVDEIVHSFIEDRQFGILGEPRVNVLKINLALDTIQ